MLVHLATQGTHMVGAGHFIVACHRAQSNRRAVRGENYCDRGLAGMVVYLHALPNGEWKVLAVIVCPLVDQGDDFLGSRNTFLGGEVNRTFNQALGIR